MSNLVEVTVELLRGWSLPDAGSSKKDRGEIVVVGGSRRVPGAVILAGEAALRVGAGRLAFGVPGSIEGQLGVMVPEAAVHPLTDDADSALVGALRDAIASADAVLVGPGFDNAEQTRSTLLAVAEVTAGVLILDAFALGVLPDVERSLLPDSLVLTPNAEEAGILLGRTGSESSPDLASDAAAVAERYSAVVACFGYIACPDGRSWVVREGGPELSTSGSGDVLAGAIAGLCARGFDTGEATARGVWTHARAGTLLAPRRGLGVLARELCAELPSALTIIE